jgi:small subunit ribosomal protein S13
MPRVAGVDIPKRKRLIIALTYVYGIGPKRSRDVLKALNLSEDMKSDELTEAQVAQLTSHLQNNYIVEGDLRREVQSNIKRLITIASYRGMRHRQ